MYSHHLPSKLSGSPQSQTLHVISVVSNPVRFAKRYELYRMFEKHMKQFDVNLITVEVAFGDRSHFVTEAGNPNHIQLRTWEELWHKENMINIGIHHLGRAHPDWQYVAWIDADVEFQRSDWVEQTKEQLQHHMFVQPWSDCIDMGPDGQVMEMHKSFCHQYVNYGFQSILAADQGYYSKPNQPIAFPHPGYAWAARREAIDAVGWLMDWSILGAGDHHMAWALVGNVEKSYPGSLPANYMKLLNRFQQKCDKHIRQDIGYVPGVINHHWHGKKKQRKYQERWAILQNNGFDPEVDIVRDSQGLLTLSGDKTQLRDDIRRYFRQRNEDSVDTE
jgi:hypothetical protein